MSGIAEKIAKASAIVGGRLRADARNREQGYDYISADKILAECGQALADVGVMVAPQIDAVNVVPVDRGSGKSRYDVMVNLTMTITDGETAQVCQWVGMGSDYAVPDKAMYKALTSGHKYFLAKLLNVGEGNEDGEHEEALPPSQRSPALNPVVRPIQASQPQSAQPVDNPFTDDAPPPTQASQPQPPATAPGRSITDKQLKMLHALGIKAYGEDGWKTKRPKLVEAVTKGERHSAADLTINEAKVLIDGLLARTQPTGNGNGHAAAESVPEAADFALPEPTF